MKQQVKIYMASRMFNVPELSHIAEFAAGLKDYAKEKGEFELKFFIPGIDTKEKQLIKKIPNRHELWNTIAKIDFGKLDWADVIIALCDGTDTDSGVAMEVGYMQWQKKAPVIKVLTDFRHGGLLNPIFYDPNMKYLEEYSVNFDTLDIIEKVVGSWHVDIDSHYSVSDNADFNLVEWQRRVNKAFKETVIASAYEKIKKIFG